MFSFHHVALSVADIEKSKQFYSFFGFKPFKEWRAEDNSRSIVHLKLNTMILELFCYKTSLSAECSEWGEGLRKIGIKHFALQVDCLRTAREKMVAAGWIKAEEGDIQSGKTGISYFFVSDPDGNPVEIVEDKRPG